MIQVFNFQTEIVVALVVVAEKKDCSWMEVFLEEAFQKNPTTSQSIEKNYPILRSWITLQWEQSILLDSSWFQCQEKLQHTTTLKRLFLEKAQRRIH